MSAFVFILVLLVVLVAVVAGIVVGIVSASRRRDRPSPTEPPGTS